jgi:hypothetical protein
VVDFNFASIHFVAHLRLVGFGEVGGSGRLRQEEINEQRGGYSEDQETGCGNDYCLTHSRQALAPPILLGVARHSGRFRGDGLGRWPIRLPIAQGPSHKQRVEAWFSRNFSTSEEASGAHLRRKRRQITIMNDDHWSCAEANANAKTDKQRC